MLSHLGITGACNVLGGLSALMSIILFVLIWKGEAVHAHSPFCNALRSGDNNLEVSDANRNPVDPLMVWNSFISTITAH
jgi:hypothetical protein